LLLKQEGAPMFSMDLSTRECDDGIVVTLVGELDVTEAASVVAGLTAVSAHDQAVIIDLAGLEYIDSSGMAALALVRRHVRRAGGDLLLAAPQGRVLRILTITRLIDVFGVHACVADAVASAERSRAAAPAAARPALLPAT
jgi:anti-sigma B factor antagonist